MLRMIRDSLLCCLLLVFTFLICGGGCLLPEKSLIPLVEENPK